MSLGRPGAVAWVLLAAASCTQPGNVEEGTSESAAETNPLGPNAGCYVCHMLFVREEVSKIHLEEEVHCTDCHGLSAAHANDEEIGATPPDITYHRDEVNPACGKCHRSHDVSPDLVVARWVERKLSEEKPVCTDCHGTHRIERPAE